MTDVPEGTYSFGPAEGQLLVKVFREGVAARVGHDLVLEARSWTGKAAVGASPAASTLEVTVDVASLTVLDAVGGTRPLSRSDRGDIKRNLEEKILDVRRFPTVSFASTGVIWSGDSELTLNGDLSIMGTSRPVAMRMRIGGGRARGSLTVTQTHWGIKPFSALMGALKVRDAVEVTLDVAVPAA
jgi:polyisoprenoid-binding protein YceI